MTNYFSNTLRGMALAGIVTALSACDTPGKLELAVRQSDGPVTIRLIQQVKEADTDHYILEVRDREGRSLAYMNTRGRPKIAKVKLSPDKTYDLNERGVRLPNRYSR